MWRYEQNKNHLLEYYRLTIAMVVAYIAPNYAYAAVTAATLGDVVCNAKSGLQGYWYVLYASMFVIGIYLSLMSFIYFNRRTANPNSMPIAKPIAYLTVGALLMSFWPFAGAVQRSLFPGISGGGGSLSNCTAGAVTSVSDSGTLDKIMQNFVANIHGPMVILLSAIAFCAGIYFIGRGLFKASRAGSDPKGGATHHIVALTFIGGILISLSTMLPTMLQTLFGADSIDNMKTFSGINWGAITSSGVDTTNADNTVRAVLAFVQIIGLIAFVRGFIMIRTNLEGLGNVTVIQGLTHILGGAMAINVGTMLKIFNQTFGLDLINP